MDGRADRLANHLRRLGVAPEVAVAVCLERSLDMVVGLLAVLKAGGAYVPLDAAYPAEQLAFILADSRAHVLLTQSGPSSMRRFPTAFPRRSPSCPSNSPITLCGSGGG